MKFKFEAFCYDKKGKLISTGVNSYKKTHPLQKHFASLVGESHKAFLHAEIAALLKTRGRDVYHIHVQRRGRNERPLNAKPCPICMKAIEAFGVKTITWSKENDPT